MKIDKWILIAGAVAVLFFFLQARNQVATMPAPFFQ